MVKKKDSKNQLPAHLPSVPDKDAAPGHYDEPPQPIANDVMPRGRTRPTRPTSRAELRLRVEELLRRKEAADEDAWKELGEDANEMLVALVHDDAIRTNPALRQRAIATLGLRRLPQGIGSLAQIVVDPDEDASTTAYAVNALGRIGTRAAAEAIVPLVGARDEMVRRQVAIALGRVRDDAVVPYLVALRNDDSPAVSEVAVEALRERARGYSDGRGLA